MQYPSFHRINSNIIAQTAILGGFALFFICTVITGQIKQYIHPRLIPFVVFAIIAFLLMIFSVLKGAPNINAKFSAKSYVIFVIPLIIALSVNPNAIKSAGLQFSGTKIVGLSPRKTSFSTNSPCQTISLKHGQTAVYTTTPYGSKIMLVITKNTITLDNENYYAWFNELTMHPQKYKGTSIKMTGYVFKSGQDFKHNEFVVGQNLMWCCAADLQLVGFLCQYDKTPQLKENSWITVTGKLDTAVYQKDIYPVILKPSITSAAKPAEDYVYPE